MVVLAVCSAPVPLLQFLFIRMHVIATLPLCIVTVLYLHFLWCLGKVVLRNRDIYDVTVFIMFIYK